MSATTMMRTLSFLEEGPASIMEISQRTGVHWFNVLEGLRKARELGLARCGLPGYLWELTATGRERIADPSPLR